MHATSGLQRWRSRLTPKHAVAVVFVLSMFMTIMDGTIVNVALPTFGRDFRVPTSSIQWVVLGYLLSLALFIPASGWIGDRVGTKRTYLAAATVFVAASGLCASAHSLTQLVAYRVIQGAGGGMMLPIGTAMLFRAYPPAERANASRILIIPTVLAPAMGPVLGGLLIDELSWRWIFTVNIPIGALALVFGTVFLREHRQSPQGRFDLLGFVLSGAGLALVLYGVSEGPLQGWVSARVLGTVAVGAAMLVAFVRLAARRADPMLRLRLLGDRIFRTSNIVSIFGFGAFMGVLFVTPLYLQEARGYSALVSGLTTFPEALGVIAASQVAARIYPRIGPRRLMTGGLVFVTGLLITFGAGGADTNLWVIRVLMFSVGAGMAFVI
ncbi:MAG: DHA2 family efflux MFS transporter permease subunit, partial [Acidimicrobiales bacterium]